LAIYTELQLIRWSKHNVCVWKPINTRLTGRPKTRWEEDMKEDLRNMNINNWKNVSRTVLNERMRRPKLSDNEVLAPEEENNNNDDDNDDDNDNDDYIYIYIYIA